MSPQARTSRPFSTDSGGAFPRLNGWRPRWEMGVGAAGHEDHLAGATGLEPATPSFGDSCSGSLESLPQMSHVETGQNRLTVGSNFCYGSVLLSTFSIRRSGMSHSSAPIIYRPKEIHCHQKAKGMAAAYSTGDSLPFQSPPMAFLRIESGPCDAMIRCCNLKYATAAISSTPP